MGRFGPHQRFLVAQQLAHSDALDELLERLDAEVVERVRPFEAEIARLDAIPGIARRTAEVLVAEVGTDMQRFPTAAHLASWAGLCPGNHESAGKRQSGRTRTGTPTRTWAAPPSTRATAPRSNAASPAAWRASATASSSRPQPEHARRHFQIRNR